MLSAAQSPSTTANITAMWDMQYRKAVSLLMYASLRMCPDITYTVSILSRFFDNLGHALWEAVCHVFWYFLGTKHLKLTYSATTLDLVSYTDTDGLMHKDCKAISSYTFLINREAVLWSSKCQELISLSTTKLEYVTLPHASKEAALAHRARLHTV